jgi:ABC-type antimicrobial peptide transport system permease subunit
MRIPLVAGRRFTPAEYLGGNAPVLIINESAARRFFPDGNVLGQFVKLGKPRRIVGVVKDSRDVRLDAEPEPTWYQPAFGAGNQLVVRVRGDASAMVERVRSELVASDRRLVVERIQPFGDIIASTVTDRRMAMRLLVTFAGLAIALAGLGLYAVLTFGVRQRLREIGVRIALGAPPSALVVDVVRNGLTMSAIGVGLGLVVSILTTRMLRSLLYDVSATDPLTIVAISGFLLLVSVAAAWHPAWRASRVDPATTLRAD